MPLNITKIALGATGVEDLRSRLEDRPDVFAVTRNMPRRREEMVGGSLYWIFDHTLIGRSPILGFSQREDRRWNIALGPKLIMVQPRARRAHQGWRYLEEADAPPDLNGEETASNVMPGRLLNQLTRLGLV
jgi:hypothetical protein